MVLRLVREVTEKGEPVFSGIDRLTQAEIEDIKFKDCINCGGQIDLSGLRGKMMDDYLRYMNGECPSCFYGVTSKREKPLNETDFWESEPTYHIDGNRERE